MRQIGPKQHEGQGSHLIQHFRAKSGTNQRIRQKTEIQYILTVIYISNDTSDFYSTICL